MLESSFDFKVMDMLLFAYENTSDQFNFVVDDQLHNIQQTII